MASYLVLLVVGSLDLPLIDDVELAEVLAECADGLRRGFLWTSKQTLVLDTLRTRLGIQHNGM